MTFRVPGVDHGDTEGIEILGSPVVLLTLRGAKSGKVQGAERAEWWARAVAAYPSSMSGLIPRRVDGAPTTLRRSR